MEKFLRTVRKSKWNKNSELKWLKDGQLQADALVDLSSKGNKLSLYLVDTDNADLQLRVVAALAANRDHIAHIDCAFIEPEFLQSIGVKIEDVDGETADDKVNAIHKDLAELTASQVFEIAKHISDKQDLRRFLKNKVEGAITSGVQNKDLDYARIKLLNKEALLPSKSEKVVNDPTREVEIARDRQPSATAHGASVRMTMTERVFRFLLALLKRDK